jgi:3-isopropylmalate/(R)-2-methylmalate dehydratase large subunit
VLHNLRPATAPGAALRAAHRGTVARPAFGRYDVSYTLAEKILAAHAQGAPVRAGDVVVARVDFAMVHDARASNALKAIASLGLDHLPHAPKTAFVLDHFSPPPTREAANVHAQMRAFCERTGAVLYDIGDGICHQVLPENGHFTAGDLVVGTDTHSTTYGAFNAYGTGHEGTDLAAILATGRTWFRVPESIRVDLTGELAPGVWAKDVTLAMLGRLGAEGANFKVIEYAGSAVGAMAIDDRMTLSNHAAELGAEAAILECDEKTVQWLAAHGAPAPRPVFADADARYVERFAIDANALAPQVAHNHDIGDVVDVTALAGEPVQVALIGTCTNGRLDDIRQAAQILKGRRIARGVRLVVTPASRRIYLSAMREGLIEILTEAGASVDPAGCGTCVGITHKLMSADRERVISSANRNFKGRLGNPESDILIASSATVAASALTGRVTDPRELALDIRRAA